MLLASHIKLWRTCSNRERLDPYNGLLLHPTIDRLFDRSLVTFDVKGNLLKAQNMISDELVTLDIDPSARLRKIPDDTQKYLNFNRDNKFEKDTEAAE